MNYHDDSMNRILDTTKLSIESIILVGVALPEKTTNESGKAMADIGSLWQEWTQEHVAARIADKTSEDVYAVYHGYEGDYTKPYAYFIGCRVTIASNLPEGLSTLAIPSGTYTRVVAKGKLPDALVTTWQNIWTSDIKRSYAIDFELYGERGKDWSNGEVEVYLS
jgi:predicted transcriptional regulator YdeE